MAMQAGKTIAPGTVLLDRYVVERTIGQGGMGAVYLGRHRLLGIPVALKVLSLPPDPTLAQRFEREAVLMARVRHPNVVSIQDYGFLEDAAPCIVMEYVEGEALDQLLARSKGIDWPDAVGIFCGILAGLEAIHASNVLHRDLKPANVLVCRGIPGSVKLIDLGIAQPTEGDCQRLTRTGVILGTPAYMAPEQLLACPLDVRTDIYASGLVLYEMLTGSPPFPGTDMASVLARLKQVPPHPQAPQNLPPLPKGLDEVVMRLLAPEPSRRPATVSLVLDVLLKLRSKTDQMGPPPARTTTVQAPHVAAESAATAPTILAPITDPRSGAGVGDTYLSASDTRVNTPFTGDNPFTPPALTAADAAPTGHMQQVRYLVAARLPAKGYSPAERQWLAQLTSGRSKSYTLGNRFWFALKASPAPAAPASTEAEELAGAIRSRYGAGCASAWSLVDASFALSASSLSGAAPLPGELTSLLERVV